MVKGIVLTILLIGIQIREWWQSARVACQYRGHHVRTLAVAQQDDSWVGVVRRGAAVVDVVDDNASSEVGAIISTNGVEWERARGVCKCSAIRAFANAADNIVGDNLKALQCVEAGRRDAWVEIVIIGTASGLEASECQW